MIRQALASWWHRNIIASDPAPALSRLDVADGLGVADELTDEQIDRLCAMVFEAEVRSGARA